MEVDIRIPIGGMFTILGVLLTIFGFITRSSGTLYARSLGVNVNLWIGLLMAVFGTIMLYFGLRARKQKKMKS